MIFPYLLFLIMFNKILKENKVFITILLLVILAILLWLGLFYFLLNKATTVAEKSRQLNQLSSYQMDVILLNSIIGQTESRRQQLSQYFYNQDSVVDFIEQIEVMAKDSGVLAQFLDIQTEDGLVTTLQVEGSLPALFIFLARLETGQFVIRFDQSNLRQESRFDEAGNENVVWVADFIISLLSFDDNEKI